MIGFCFENIHSTDLNNSLLKQSSRQCIRISNGKVVCFYSNKTMNTNHHPLLNSKKYGMLKFQFKLHLGTLILIDQSILFQIWKYIFNIILTFLFSISMSLIYNQHSMHKRLRIVHLSPALLKYCFRLLRKRNNFIYCEFLLFLWCLECLTRNSVILLL